MALRSYSVLYILLPTIVIIIQKCSHALEICKCLWSLSCGGVPNMLLVLSITFHFHWYIWGCMCSTGPFQFRWLRGYIHSSCYYHHQIGSINLTHYHIFPWLCLLHHILSLIAYTFRENRDFVFIIIVQIMMSANIRIRFGLQIVSLCFYITPSHHHHCETYLRTLNLWNARQIYFVECVSKIKHIFSVIHYAIYGALCFQFTHFHCDDWENIHFILLSSSNRKYELLSIVKGYVMKQWYVCFSIFLSRVCIICDIPCVQHKRNALFQGWVTEIHRLKVRSRSVNSKCDTALFIPLYDIIMARS